MLKDDREVVLEAVKNFLGLLCFAPKHLRSDREIILTAVKLNGHDQNTNLKSHNRF